MYVYVYMVGCVLGLALYGAATMNRLPAVLSASLSHAQPC